MPVTSNSNLADNIQEQSFVSTSDNSVAFAENASNDSSSIKGLSEAKTRSK